MFGVAQLQFPTINLPFFSSSTKKDPFPLKDSEDLEKLATLLTTDTSTTDQWMGWKKEIRAALKNQQDDLDSIDRFIETLLEWGFRHDPQQSLQFFNTVLDVELLNKIAIKKSSEEGALYDDVYSLASENKMFCPKPTTSSMRNMIQSEWRKHRPQILYFIPNLLNIFLGAFNFLDATKKYTNLWDKYLLIEIVYKFFLIPYCVIQLLKPYIKVTAKVYAVAAAIIVVSGILIACYQRWLRPLPNHLINCTNLDNELEMGHIDPKVGQEEELGKFIEALLAGSNVLIVGRSGEGKTALMHHFVQLKAEKKLPPDLQKLTSFELDCGLMISHVSYGHSQLINQTREQIEGYENQVLFFLDEFYQLANHKEAFKAFQKRFLEDKPATRFVAAVTLEEFKLLQDLDIDGSFMRRVVPLSIKASSDEQCRLVLYDLVQRKAQDIPILDEAIEAVLELSEKEDFLPTVGRTAKAVKLLNDAVGISRAAFSPHYASEELNSARQDCEVIRTKITYRGKADADMQKQFREVQKIATDLESALEKQNQQVKKIKKIIDCQVKYKEEYFRLTHRLADAKEKKGTASEDDQKRYLLYHFYGMDGIKKILQEEIDPIQEERPIQVDEALVRLAYEQCKFTEEDLGDNEVDDDTTETIGEDSDDDNEIEEDEE